MSVVQIDRRQVQVRMIGGVEGLPPELQHLLLAEVEIFNERSIHVQDAGPDQRVAARIAEGAERLRRKGCLIEEMLRAAAPGRAGGIWPVKFAPIFEVSRALELILIGKPDW